jgi:iron(III) transport system substrate-binding protein
MNQLFRMLALAAATAVVTTSCSGETEAVERESVVPNGQAAASRVPGDILTVYSRYREIAEPLFDQFEQQTGIEIRTRWGDPIELADQTLEDGANSPADVFMGRSAMPSDH